MSGLVYLIPIHAGAGCPRPDGVLWALHAGQFDDLDGAAERILFDADE